MIENEIDLCAHIDHEFASWVGNVEQCIIENDIVVGLWRWLDLTQCAGKPFVRLAEQGEINRHIGLKFADIGFRDLCLDRHHLEIRNRDDRRRTLHGVQCFAFLGGLVDDGASHRAVNLGVAEIDLIAGKLRFLLADLRA